MKPTCYAWLWMVIGCGMIGCPLGAGLVAAAEYPWQAGVAKAEITPRESTWMAGYAARKAPSDGKVHELYAKAVALKSEQGHRLVIVTLDLIGVTSDLNQHVLKACGEKFGLGQHEILLNASHTHCGPELRPERVGLWGLPAEQAPIIERNLKFLQQQVVGVIGQALADLKPARLAVGQDAADFARNRRFPTENGFSNRQYDEGPVDHEVPVLQVWRPEASGPGESLSAVLFGYACHNTTLSIQQFCGDYAGFAQLEVEKQFPGTQAMFVMGAAGDQNPYPRREMELAIKHGAALAAAVQRAIQAPAKDVTASLSTARTDVTLAFQPLPARKELEAMLASKNVYQVRKAKYLLDRIDSNRPIEMTYPCPVQAVRLGKEVLLVAIGGEVVVDYSHKIKGANAGGPLVWVAGYSNDVFGYLPSRRVLLEGGYEGGGAMLYGTLPGPFQEDVEQRVLGAVETLLHETKNALTR